MLITEEFLQDENNYLIRALIRRFEETLIDAHSVHM